jgi:preprotein translocase subunit SecD
LAPEVVEHGMKLRCGFVCWAVLLALCTLAGAPKPTVAWRVHLQVAGEGMPRSQAFPLVLAKPAEQIYIKAFPELSERDIFDVRAFPAEGSLGMVVKLTPHGAHVLSSVTLQNNGQILVVFLNGRVIYSPVIDRQITSGELVIPRGVQMKEIEQIKALAGKSKKF